MKKINAFIKEDNDNALWLIVEGGEEGTAHPIFKEEVQAILEACQKYLEEVTE